MAQEQFDAEMEHERQLRKLAEGLPLDEGWSETLLREQQSIWNAMRRTTKTQDRAPSRIAFGASSNAAAGPSRAALNAHHIVDSANAAYDDTARYSRWTRSMQPTQAQPEWRDGK